MRHIRSLSKTNTRRYVYCDPPSDIAALGTRTITPKGSLRVDCSWIDGERPVFISSRLANLLKRRLASSDLPLRLSALMRSAIASSLVSSM